VRRRLKLVDEGIFKRLEGLMVELLQVDEAKSIPRASFVDDLVADSLDCMESITAHVTRPG